MRKQGMKVSPFELRCLANKLDVNLGDREITEKKLRDSDT